MIKLAIAVFPDGTQVRCRAKDPATCRYHGADVKHFEDQAQADAYSETRAAVSKSSQGNSLKKTPADTDAHRLLSSMVNVGDGVLIGSGLSSTMWTTDAGAIEAAKLRNEVAGEIGDYSALDEPVDLESKWTPRGLDGEPLGRNPVEWLRERLDSPLRVSFEGKPVDKAFSGASAEDLYRETLRRLDENESQASKLARFFERKSNNVRSYAAVRLLSWQEADAKDEAQFLERRLGPEKTAEIRKQLNWHDDDWQRDRLKRGEAIREYKGSSYENPFFRAHELNYPKSHGDIYRDIATYQKRSFEDVRSEVHARMDAGADMATAMQETYKSHSPHGEYVGIDLETTQGGSMGGSIIDVGVERINMDDGSQYGAQAEQYGVTRQLAQAGNKFEDLTGISFEGLDGKKPFREDVEAQDKLVRELSTAPMVAHNAKFEDSWLKANCRGYAEARRAGRIKIVDTMLLSRRLDSDRGGNSLEKWSRRWGALGNDEAERHLGYEDTHIMNAAMYNMAKAGYEH